MIHRIWLSIALLLLGVVLVPAVAKAEEPPTSDDILAIVSPIASPACLASGLGTFLVPTIGDQLDSAVGGAIDLSTVLGQATGPVLVICGTLPPSDGTRCALVDSVPEVVWPPQLGGAGLQPPPVAGSVVEGLDNLLAIAALGSLPIADVLQCAAPVPDPGGELPTAPTPTPLTTAATPTSGSTSTGASPGAAISTRPPSAVTPQALTTAPNAPAAAAATPLGAIAARTPGGRGGLLGILGLLAATGLWRYSQTPSRRQHALEPGAT